MHSEDQCFPKYTRHHKVQCWVSSTSNKMSPTLSRPSCSATPPEQISLTLSMLPLVPPTKAKPRPPPSGFVNSTCMMQLCKDQKWKGEAKKWIFRGISSRATVPFSISVCFIPMYLQQHLLSYLKKCCCVVNIGIKWTEKSQRHAHPNTHKHTRWTHSRQCTRRLTCSRLMLQCVFVCTDTSENVQYEKRMNRADKNEGVHKKRVWKKALRHIQILTSWSWVLERHLKFPAALHIASAEMTKQLQLLLLKMINSGKLINNSNADHNKR